MKPAVDRRTEMKQVPTETTADISRKSFLPQWNRTRKIFWVVLACALGLRVWYAIEIRDSPLTIHHLLNNQTDTYNNIVWSDRILSGDLLGRETFHPDMHWQDKYGDALFWRQVWGGDQIFHQAPLYVYLISLVRLLDRQSIWPIIILQLILELLSAFLIALTASLVFGRKVGVLTFVLATLMGPNLYYASLVQRDFIVYSVQAALLYLFVSRRIERPYFIGLIIGFCVLLRPPFVFYLGYFLLIFGFSWRNLKLLSGFTTALSPLILRNILVNAPVLAISTRAKEALILGHCVDSHPFQLVFPKDYGTILTQASDIIGVFYRAIATCTLDQYLLLQAKKVLAIFQPYEIPNNFSYIFAKDWSNVLKFLPGYYPVFVLGFLGVLIFIASHYRQSREQRLASVRLYWWVLLTVAGLMISNVLSRYRLPMVIPMLIMSAYALDECWYRIRNKDGLGLLYLSLGLLAILIPYYTFSVRIAGLQFRPTEYFLAGQYYLEHDDFPRAERIVRDYERNAAKWPEQKGDSGGFDLIRSKLKIAGDETFEAVFYLNRLIEIPLYRGEASYLLGMLNITKLGRTREGVRLLSQALPLLACEEKKEHIAEILRRFKPKVSPPEIGNGLQDQKDPSADTQTPPSDGAEPKMSDHSENPRISE